jgi:phosphoheptose isomerase
MMPADRADRLTAGRLHLRRLRDALEVTETCLDAVEDVGGLVATRLLAGQRLLAAGNGGSAAHAQHLTSELVGRYRDERRPLSAVCLHGDTSSLTAIVNDYGAYDMFARQVAAHGRDGDVFVAFSTSGRSPNLVAASDVARRAGLVVLTFTGPLPNPLADRADLAMPVPSDVTATVQEIHQVLIHLLCAAVDAHVAAVELVGTGGPG